MDLCAGTHVRYTAKLKAFKLLSIAGAYHRGDETNKQLQRIYGTAFPTKEELANYSSRWSRPTPRPPQARQGAQLFHIDEDVGQGLILWTPNGSILRQELQNFILRRTEEAGLLPGLHAAHRPALALQTSGHFPTTRTRSSRPSSSANFLDQLISSGCSCAEMSNRIDAVSLAPRREGQQSSPAGNDRQDRVLPTTSSLTASC